MSETELQTDWGQLGPFKCSTYLMDTSLALVGLSSLSYTGRDIFHWCIYIHTVPQICIEISKTCAIEAYALCQESLPASVNAHCFLEDQHLEDSNA